MDPPESWSSGSVKRHAENPVTREHSLEDLIRRPEMTYNQLMQVEDLGPALEDPLAAEQVEIQIKYAGYIERQKDEIAKTDVTKIPCCRRRLITARFLACPTKWSRNSPMLDLKPLVKHPGFLGSHRRPSRCCWST